MARFSLLSMALIGVADAVTIIACVLYYSNVAGYIVLLSGKKKGFFILCTGAACNAFLGIAVVNIPQAAFAFVSPLITWLLLRGSWDGWAEFDRKNRGFAAEIDRVNARTGVESQKTALILASIPYTGWFGVDRFYLGYVGTGLLKLFMMGRLFVWWIIDLVKIVNRKMTDKQGRPLI